ncbi:unnamed protein product [Rotaria socialis]|uniref:Protein kinase domain-containing protein n=1 Tax=Rotaria socialis TaxID=392032 RepID=A0A819UYD6_9BILA|nr:unnamed protein product [Rotaria socialis]
MARVLATIQHNTAGNGTSKYTAPELLDANTKYGEEVDTYSSSLILYEMVSGKIAFENMNAIQLMTAIYLHKKRPDFDSTFSKKLQKKVELGWSHDAKERCKLDDILQIISMGETLRVSMIEQANNTQKK